MADREAVSQLLGMLSILFQDKKTSPDFYKIYQEFLKDIPDEVIIPAIKECICSCKFFPTIAEIREKAKPFFEKMLLLKSVPEIKDCKKNIIKSIGGTYFCEIKSTCKNGWNGECYELKAISEIKEEKYINLTLQQLNMKNSNLTSS